jgi:ketosteroid isomerase-like protein
MRRVALLVFALALPAAAFAASTVTVQSGPPDEQVQRLVDAERAFAKKALDTNIRDAFFENMAEEAILFRPTPVNGKEFFRGRPANPGPVLAWYPSYAELSGTGDMGWTTGPWEFRPAKDKKPEAWGHFASVWSRDTKGKFHVLLDEGHSCPKAPPQDSLTWARLPGSLNGREMVPLAELSATREALTATDAAYSQLLVEKGVGEALARHADDDVRLLRDERAELRGMKDAGKELAKEWAAGATAWDVKIGGMSQANDLAFTYGIVTLGAKAKDSPDGRKVFRVWRRRPGAEWKLALDVTNPVPPPPPAPKKP